MATKTKKKHLWEVDHPYYCNQGNYFARESVEDSYGTWAAFEQEYRDSDFDMNLVFRWDWEFELDDEEKPIVSDDPNYRDGTLLIFWMGQRKGLYRYSRVSVCRADEPKVRAWLQPRLEHLMTLWEPLVSASR